MPLRNTDTLIFVYNADSGLFNLVSDMAHKLLSPGTYNCQLCMLTHGHFGMRDQWHEYLQTLGVNHEFLHKDEFVKTYSQHGAQLPALFLKREGVPELLLSADEIDGCATLDDLIAKLNQKITLIPA